MMVALAFTIGLACGAIEGCVISVIYLRANHIRIWQEGRECAAQAIEMYRSLLLEDYEQYPHATNEHLTFVSGVYSEMAELARGDIRQELTVAKADVKHIEGRRLDKRRVQMARILAIPETSTWLECIAAAAKQSGEVERLRERVIEAEKTGTVMQAMMERMPEQHMRFGQIHPDGTTEMFPCADWCTACKLDRLRRLELMVSARSRAHWKGQGEIAR